MNYVVHDIGIPHNKIVILGQSLGTAVATAVGLHFATLDAPSELLPTLPETPAAKSRPQVFAGIILVAPFTSLPSLLLSYRIGGLIPVLAPLRSYPRLTALVETYILDKWPTARRLAKYVNMLENNALIADSEKAGRKLGSVQIIHATNDADISVEQGRLLYAEAIKTETLFEEVGETSSKLGRGPWVRLHIVEHGGEFGLLEFVGFDGVY